MDQDQLIGISGGKYYSGFSTGCHLHYQLQKNGNFIDPAKESLYIKDWQKIFTGLVGAFAIYKYIIPYFDQKLKK